METRNGHRVRSNGRAVQSRLEYVKCQITFESTDRGANTRNFMVRINFQNFHHAIPDTQILETEALVQHIRSLQLLNLQLQILKDY